MLSMYNIKNKNTIYKRIRQMMCAHPHLIRGINQITLAHIFSKSLFTTILFNIYIQKIILHLFKIIYWHIKKTFNLTFIYFGKREKNKN